jgi:hypothetical protein
MKNIILITFLSLFLFNCNSDDSPSNVDPNVFPQEMSITTIIQQNAFNVIHIEIFSNQKLIIQNENAWNTFKTTMNEESGVVGANFTDIYFSETEIDFSQFQVVAIFDIIRNRIGTNNSGVYVANVVEFENSITVNYNIVYNPSPLNTSWQGYHIIKMPKSDKEIVFVQQQ